MKFPETKKGRNDCIDFVLERDHWVCAGRVIGTACRGLLTAHEVVQRSVRKGSQFEPDLQVAICHLHHMWAHDNIAKARTFGLIRDSWEVDASGRLLPKEEVA